MNSPQIQIIKKLFIITLLLFSKNLFITLENDVTLFKVYIYRTIINFTEMAYLDYKGALYHKNMSRFDYLYILFPKIIFIINENLDESSLKTKFSWITFNSIQVFLYAYS